MNWTIEKAEGGASFYLQVGVIGAPGSVRVDGLTRQQGADLGEAIRKIVGSAKYQALENVRDALGIKQRP